MHAIRIRTRSSLPKWFVPWGRPDQEMTMQDLIELVVCKLVDHPDEVHVTTVTSDESVVYEVRVAASDVGKALGRQGRIASAVRTIVKAAAMKDQRRVFVEFVGSARPPAKGPRREEPKSPS
jgi:predicted RNA-binding protein YlqC (UPF0109 family)